MPAAITRRAFLIQTSFSLTALPFLSFTSSFITPTSPGLQVGYSAITWGGNDVQAIKDIAALGFKGIQLRSNTLKDFGSKPQELRALLEQYHLQLPMFSSGNANINTGNDEQVIQQHVTNAQFVKALGGKNIQITNSSRTKGVSPSAEDLENYGRLLNEIGKRTKEIGVQSHYHNHMGQLGQTPEEVDRILNHCDSSNVKFLLDIAHYHQGGGDPVKAIQQYNDRISVLHLKDVQPNPAAGAEGYTFVELGQGRVNLPAVFNALDKIKFKGWGIVELDAVPDKAKTPVECATISKAYLKKQKIKI